MSDRTGLLVAFLLCVTAIGMSAGLSGQVGANHGADVNYTVVPHEAPDDRRPGDTAASYRQFGVSTRDIAYLDYVAATWNAGGFSGCQPTDSKVLGIDRDNDDPGTEIDVNLEPYVEETTVDPHYFEIDFFERDDLIGSSTNLAAGDQLVGFVTNCYDNPPRAGWYQIRSSVGGWGDDGSYIQRNVTSHYFWICDCSSEREARKRLGPPPSAETPTPSSTVEPDRTASPAPRTKTAGESPTPTANGPTAMPETAGSSVTGTADRADRTGEPASRPTTGSVTSPNGTTAGTASPVDGGASGIGPMGAVAAILLGVLLRAARVT